MINTKIASRSIAMISARSRIFANIFPVILTVFVAGLSTDNQLQAEDASSNALPDASQQLLREPQAYPTRKPPSPAVMDAIRQALHTGAAADSSPILPLWFYNVLSPRDKNKYSGFGVGTDPFHGG